MYLNLTILVNMFFDFILFVIFWQIKRFVGLLEEVYGKAAYKASKQPNWVNIAKRPTFIDVPKQNNNDCGFFAVKFCSSYDGDEFVEDFGDVKVCFCPCFCLSIFFSFFLVCFC
jgi:hypothetical protein